MNLSYSTFVILLLLFLFLQKIFTHLLGKWKTEFTGLNVTSASLGLADAALSLCCSKVISNHVNFS